MGIPKKPKTRTPPVKVAIPPASKRVSEQTARARKEQALAEMRELELQQLKGEIVEVAKVRKQWLDMAGTIKTAILALPSAVAPRVVSVRDAQHAELIVREEVEAMLRQVGGEFARHAA